MPVIRCHFSVSDKVYRDEANVLKDYGPSEFLVRFYSKTHRPGAFHRDKDYGLRLGAINLWVPVVNTFGTNGIWIGGENKFGLDAAPQIVSRGQYLCFDGVSQWHGTVWNTTGITRFSFDIRFFPRVSLWGQLSSAFPASLFETTLSAM